jgi:hypothetical protein
MQGQRFLAKAAAVCIALAVTISVADAGWDYVGTHKPHPSSCGGARMVALSRYNLPGSQVSISTRARPVYFNAEANTCASNMPDGFQKGRTVNLRNPRTGQTSHCIINDTLPRTGDAWRVGVRLDATPLVFRQLGPLGPGRRKESGWVCAS